MTRRLVALLVLLVALVAADRGLAAAEAARRERSRRIGYVFGEAERTAGPLAAVRVETGDESFFYGYKDGQWRCLSWRNALADGAAMQRLAGAVTQAVGHPVAREPSDPATFGFGDGERTRVTLHGPRATRLDARRDVLVSVELGRAFADGSGSYLRRTGAQDVWSVDVAPGELLGRSAPRQPPLLDRRLVPEGWPGLTPRVQSITVERAGEPTYVLEMRARPMVEGADPTSRPLFEWVLVDDGVERPCAALLVLYYVDHLLEARWEGLSDPVLLPHLGFESAAARVTLRSGDAEPLSLVLAGRRPGAPPVVLGTPAGMIYEIAADDEALLFPAVSVFAPDAERNPWVR